MPSPPPSPPTEAFEAFSHVLGARSILTSAPDIAPYLSDWSGDLRGSALAVLLPASTEEVSACLRLARAHGLAVIPQGGNTGLVGGTYSEAGRRQILLNLRRMNRIRNLDPANFSMEVEAGAILQTVKTAADEAGLFFPLAFGSQGSCQIGGNIATNAGGLNVLKYGMTRNLVLGIEAVLPDGGVFNGLKKLWKDNRGIDLKQLFIGAEGTLGIVTAAVLKLFPKPENVETCLIGVTGVPDATRFFLEARRNFGDLLTAFELIDAACIRLTREMFPQLHMPMSREYPTYVLFEVSSGKAIPLREITENFLGAQLACDLLQDAVLAASQEQARRIWTLREALIEAQALKGRHFRSDVSLPLSAIADFILFARETVLAAVPGCLPIIYGHMGDGNIHFNVLPPAGETAEILTLRLDAIGEALYAAVERFDGSISAEHGIGRVKRDRFLRGIEPMHRNLLNKIAVCFDESGRMNPGCMLPGDALNVP